MLTRNLLASTYIFKTIFLFTVSLIRDGPVEENFFFSRHNCNNLFVAHSENVEKNSDGLK